MRSCIWRDLCGGRHYHDFVRVCWPHLNIDWSFAINFNEGIDDEVHDNTFDAQDVIVQ